MAHCHSRVGEPHPSLTSATFAGSGGGPTSSRFSRRLALSFGLSHDLGIPRVRASHFLRERQIRTREVRGSSQMHFGCTSLEIEFGSRGHRFPSRHTHKLRLPRVDRSIKRSILVQARIFHTTYWTMTADAGRIAFDPRALRQPVKAAELLRFRTAHTARSFPPLPNLPRSPAIPACIWGSAFVLNFARNRIRVPHRHRSCGGR